MVHCSCDWMDMGGIQKAALSSVEGLQNLTGCISTWILMRRGRILTMINSMLSDTSYLRLAGRLLLEW